MSVPLGMSSRSPSWRYLGYPLKTARGPILMNPSTYAGMLSQKTTGSGERLDSSGAFDSPADSIWGVSVIQSSIVDPSVAIVADWGRATTLYVREGALIRMSDADQDDFLRGQVTVFCESRVGLAVWQPSAIVQVTVASS